MVKTKPIKSKEKRTIVSNKKKDRDQFIKEIDMIILKQKINEMMKKVSNDKIKIENDHLGEIKKTDSIKKNNINNMDVLYQDMFQKYMKEGFTLVYTSFINKIILDMKRNHLEQYEGKFNFNKIFVSLSKDLLLNEFELILFSLYLEYIDISSFLNYFSLENSLLFLGFFVKKLTINKNELEAIISYLDKKYDNFGQNYENWLKIIEEKNINKLYFNYLQINNRFKEYNAPFNAYCGENYIDYNYIVDKILTMSLPYVDVKKNNNNSKTNNNSILSTQNGNNKNIKTYNNNDENMNNKNINNHSFDNNKINLNQENYDKTNFNSEPLINIGIKPKINSIPNIDSKFEPNNINYNNFMNKNNINLFNELNNKNIANNIPSTITPNNLLHSLGNINRYMIAPGSNKMMINPNLLGNINKTNISQSIRQIEEDFGAKKMSSNLIFNPMQTPSQSSFIFQQKPSLMEINLFNRNNSSQLFDEGDTLKQILRASNENFRSSMSFDSPKYPYGAFASTGNNNLSNMNNNANNIMDPKEKDINKTKYNKDMSFRPVNIVGNNIGSNNLNSNKIIYYTKGINIEKNINYINNEKK